MRRTRRAGRALALGLVCLAGSRLPGVAGQAALYLSLGVFPGMAVGEWLAGRAPGAPRWALGLALAPLVSAGLGAVLLMAGVTPRAAALGIALAGWLAWLALALARPEDETLPAEADAADRAFMLGWGAVLVAVAALPWLANPWILVRSDGWVHGALSLEILNHGLPPEDPRFAGLTANFMWFYNLFVALLASLGPGPGPPDPFVPMALFNTLNLAVCAALAYRVALEVWGGRGAARGAALLTVLGLNAGAWLLWPLGLSRAFVGSTRGWTDVMYQVRVVRPGTCDIIFSLHAPFSWMVLFLDKFTVGTSLSYAWILLLLWLWALPRWLERGRREALAWAVLAAAGMPFFHVVVGASAVPVALATLGLAWLLTWRRGRAPGWAWLPSRGRLVALAVATAAGALLAVPYTLAVSSGWSPEKSGFRTPLVKPNLTIWWTLATSCAVTLWFARRPLARAFRERRPAAAVLALFTLVMAVFAVVVHLRLDNESKFVFQVFLPLALFGGAALLPEVRAFVARRGPWLAWPVLALLFLAGPALLLQGYCADPAGRSAPQLHPAPGERHLYEWIRTRTEGDAVLVDAKGRDLIMVLAERRLWVGTLSKPELAAFPVQEMAARRAVEADLYGPGADLGGDARALARLGRPAYVVYRPGDFDGAEPWRNLERPGAPFTLAYDASGFRVYRLRGL